MFQRAQKKQVKLKMAITGPSGHGKTFSSLKIAFGISDKVAVIDTENGSASLYENYFPPYFVCNIYSPFTTDKYLLAIDEAIRLGYKVLVIDSGTHAWSGEGGVLTRKNEKDAEGGNSYTNWAPYTKEQNLFIERIKNADIHLIFTMRSKQDYTLVDNDKGKKVPVKVGLAPIQRDSVEYEFDVVFDISADHTFTVSKDRTNLFGNRSGEVITEIIGKELLEWLDSGAPAAVTPQPISGAPKHAIPLTTMPTPATAQPLKGHGNMEAPRNFNMTTNPFDRSSFLFQPIEGTFYPLNVLEIMPPEDLKANFLELTAMFKGLCEKANKLETCEKVLEAVAAQQTRYEKIWMLEAYILKIDTYLKEQQNAKS